MKVLVVYPSYAYSFLIQAQALARGFTENGVENSCIPVSSEDELEFQLGDFKPEIVVSVGNWPDYVLLAGKIRLFGYPVLPWIVCDENKMTNFVEEFNSHKIIVTPSIHGKNNMVRSGIRKEIIEIIPEAVDPDIWYRANEEEIKKFLDLVSTQDPNPDRDFKFNLASLRERGIPILFTTGGSATKKGAQEVIRALSLLDKSIPWVYIIKTWVFPVIFEDAIEELNLAKELGIFDRIRYFAGEFSQTFMRGLVNICDIYVAPSRIESFGLPLVEAQMCGKPVVTMAATSTQEIVVHGKTGFLCKKDISYTEEARADIPDLANYLKKLLTDKTLRRQMGEQAFNYARQNYSPKIIAGRFLELMKKVEFSKEDLGNPESLCRKKGEKKANV